MTEQQQEEGWGMPTRNWSKNLLLHYFVNNGEKTLCGRYIYTIPNKNKINFAPVSSNIRKCSRCQKSLHYYEKYGVTRIEYHEQQTDEVYAKQIKSKSLWNQTKHSSETWIKARCSHINEKGKRCTFVGEYPTGDPVGSAKRDHFCVIHNLRVKVAVSQ